MQGSEGMALCTCLQALVRLSKQWPPYFFALLLWNTKLFMHELKYVCPASRSELLETAGAVGTKQMRPDVTKEL